MSEYSPQESGFLLEENVEMSAPVPGPHDVPNPQGYGYPPPGYAPGYPPPRRGGRSLVLGLVLGLVVGAGGLGLAWALSSRGSGGVRADAQAVCGVVERTAVPTKDTSLEDFRRWGIAEVGPSLAKQDATYQPLADELAKASDAVGAFDFDKLKRA
ncbi:hypothetical protein, partial [Actinophytocola sp.]|uniref:hypothetical protein n=1 Tax=Actinophytocola sp. TaxID=1872138 RepID=UPI002ED8ADDF